MILHETTMKIPIFNSIYSNNELYNKNQNQNLNLKKMNNLNFSTTNSKKFPIIRILNNLPAKHSLFETAIVSINDFLVDKFLKKKINIVDISKIFLRLLNSKSYLK